MKSHSKAPSLFDRAIIRQAVWDSLRKLSPAAVAHNPVMFVVEVGSVLTTLTVVRDLIARPAGAAPLWFTAWISVWLWITVVFANFAEAVAEGRGKAQADSLRKMRTQTPARRLREGGGEDTVASTDLRAGDRVVVEAGQLIPGDGEVIEGVASVDESAITGESAPVIREAGGDRSSVTGGTKVLSDRIVIRIMSNPGETFLDRMIALVEGASRQKTPNEIALHILLVGLTLVFLFACVTLVPLALYAGIRLSPTVIVALLVCLIPTPSAAWFRPSHRGHGSLDPQERDRHERPGHRGCRRRGRLAARQDRHHHHGEPHGHGLFAHRRRFGRGSGRRGATGQPGRRNARGRSIVVLAKQEFRLRGRETQAS